MTSCIKWICYKDPTRRQCEQIVEKKRHSTQCKRYSTKFCYACNGYYCDLHYDFNNCDVKRRNSSILFGNKNNIPNRKRKSLDSDFSSDDSL